MRVITEYLFSKFGMGDGDILDDLVWEHCTPDEYQQFDDHRLLFDVVAAHVAPLIHPDLAARMVFTTTCHNPLRVDDYNWYEDLWLDAPDSIDVDDAIIVAMLEKQKAAHPSHIPT